MQITKPKVLLVCSLILLVIAGTLASPLSSMVNLAGIKDLQNEIDLMRTTRDSNLVMIENYEKRIENLIVLRTKARSEISQAQGGIDALISSVGGAHVGPVIAVIKELIAESLFKFENATREIAQLEELRDSLWQTNHELQLDIASKTHKLANTHTLLVNLAIAAAMVGLVGVVASAAVYVKAQKKK